MDNIVPALLMVLSPQLLFFVVLGTFLGILVGAIPGLTAVMLISLTLPLTFIMDGTSAIVLLVSMYVGGVTGALITATLLNVPGTPSAVMTTLDGYPMTREGNAGRALGLGITASFIGGVISWIFLATLALPLSRIAIQLRQFDYFAMVIMAMVVIATISGRNLLKGLLSGALGLLAATPGIDPIEGSYRLTFGINGMAAGFSLLPVLIGLFAGSQVLRDVVMIDERIVRTDLRTRAAILTLADLRRQCVNLVRSSLIGTWVGILPGIGAAIGSMLAYSAARAMSHTPEQFGHGSEEGVVASEAGNNATIGGALIPLIALGIPGSVVDAVLIGALAIHNVAVGPRLFVTNPDITYAIIATALIANFVMLLMMYGLTRYFLLLVAVPRAFLIPIIVVFSVTGSFALANRWFDVGVMLAFSGIGYLFVRSNIPLGPFVIGVVLEPIAELAFRSGLMISGGNIRPLFSGPFSLTFLGLAVLTLIWPLCSRLILKARGMGGSVVRTRQSTADGDRSRPEFDAVMGIAIILGGAIVLVAAWSLPNGNFGQLGSGYIPIGLVSLVIVLAISLFARAIFRLHSGAERDTRTEYLIPRPMFAVFIATVTFIYVTAMSLLGTDYALATTVFLFLSITVLGRFKRKWMVLAVPIAAFSGFGLEYVFTRVFLINLP